MLMKLCIWKKSSQHCYSGMLGKPVNTLVFFSSFLLDATFSLEPEILMMKKSLALSEGEFPQV